MRFKSIKLQIHDDASEHVKLLAKRKEVIYLHENDEIREFLTKIAFRAMVEYESLSKDDPEEYEVDFKYFRRIFRQLELAESEIDMESDSSCYFRDRLSDHGMDICSDDDDVSPEDFFLYNYGSKFEPKYRRFGECPNEIEVSEREFPVVMDELLFKIWSNSSVFLEVTEDGKMPFFYQQEVNFLKELSEALRGVTENRILKMTHYVRYWIADDLYGARKCWKSFIKNR